MDASELNMLQEAYMEYAACLQSPGSEGSRLRQARLFEQLQARGVHGHNALQLVQRHADKIKWQGMSNEVFSSFYRFVFFICREVGKRNVQVQVAVAAWRVLLQGRFRLLDRWCDYITTHYKGLVVVEDTWRQVLDFSRTVHEDLSNYDPTSAWPVLLDDFVEHIRRSSTNRSTVDPSWTVDLLNQWPADRALTAVSPRSGSKRRLPTIVEVVEQLQQLPLGSNGEQQQQQASTVAAAPPAFSSGAGGSPPAAVTGRLAPKRFRAAGPAAAGSRPAQAAGCDSCEAMTASPMASVTAGSGSSPGPRSGGALHPMSKSLGGGHSRCPWSPHGHQQQQQQFHHDSSGGFGPFTCGAMPGLSPHLMSGSKARAAWRPASAASGGSACLQECGAQNSMDVSEQCSSAGPGAAAGAASMPTFGSTLPPCFPGAGPNNQLVQNMPIGPFAARNMEEYRRSSVNAMMSVTVTEALGFI